MRFRNLYCKGKTFEPYRCQLVSSRSPLTIHSPYPAHALQHEPRLLALSRNLQQHTHLHRFPSRKPRAASSSTISTSPLPAVLKLPTHLASQRWRQPTDKTSTAIHAVHSIPVDCKTTYFDWVAAHPIHRSTFNSAMRAQTVSLFGSATLYPFDIVLSSASSTSIVDIGGGRGQSLIQIVQNYPTLLTANTKLYLQDLSPVIAEARAQGLTPYIQTQTHNFFTPQPVRGAALYHLSQILHDWPDADAVLILRHVADAMDGVTSHVLIVDRCLPEDREVPPEMAMLDLYMMALAASVERGGGAVEGVVGAGGAGAGEGVARGGGGFGGVGG